MSEHGLKLHSLARRLFPICRSLAGPGFRETLDILEEVTGPMHRHRWETGEELFDWVVPEEWGCRNAWIKAPDGQTIIDFTDTNLHVLSYSEPVHERLTLEELQKHLYSLPEQPTAVPYLTSYYQRRWGFCLAHEQRERLQRGEYEVMIDSDLGPGHLEVGEVVIPGKSNREVLFSTYCCHPSMGNNELSGPVIAASLARELRDRSPLRYTYRVAFVPETIGAIAYLTLRGEHFKQHLDAGWVVTCAGDRGNLTYKRSRRGDSLADRATEHMLSTTKRPHKLVDFFPGGSDERQYCSPGFDLPVGSLMRTMYGRYPEYHTHLDDLSFITPEALADTFAAYTTLIEVLEANGVYQTTVPYGEPQLGKRGLYPTLGSQKERSTEVGVMMWLLNLCDGESDLLEVAERAELSVLHLAPVAESLREAGLLTTPEAAPWDRL